MEKLRREARIELDWRVKELMEEAIRKNEEVCISKDRLIRGIDMSFTPNPIGYVNNFVQSIHLKYRHPVRLKIEDDEICFTPLKPIRPIELKTNVFTPCRDVDLHVISVEDDMLGLFVKSCEKGWVFVHFGYDKVSSYTADIKKWREILLGLWPHMLYRLSWTYEMPVGWIAFNDFFKRRLGRTVDFSKDIWWGTIIKGRYDIYYKGFCAFYMKYLFYQGYRNFKRAYDKWREFRHNPKNLVSFLKGRYPYLTIKLEVKK